MTALVPTEQKQRGSTSYIYKLKKQFNISCGEMAAQ